MVVSSALIYLRATRPSEDLPVEITVLRHPDDLFGTREQSPSMVLSLVCQKPIEVLDIRFTSTVEWSHGCSMLSERIEDPGIFLSIEPLPNLSSMLADYGAEPRALSYEVEVDDDALASRTYSFDSSAGGVIGSGAFLVYDFLLNSSDHLVACLRGMEDFFVIAGESLTYLAIEHNANISEYVSEERPDAMHLRDRPEGGLARFRDLSPGDIVSVTLRWRPNTKACSEEVRQVLSGSFFIQRMEITADGTPLDLELDPILLRNLG